MERQSNIEVTEEAEMALQEYATVPIAFQVKSILDVTKKSRRHEFVLTEKLLPAPYMKDYDSLCGENPTQWEKRFDLSHWVLFGARAQGQLVGGAAIAFSTPRQEIFEGLEDLAILWDIRVSPGVRGQGVGAALFAAAEAKARVRGCRVLKVETQNVNVGACRFYERQGCVLRAVNPRAYAEQPDEVQMLWYKDLSNDLASAPHPHVREIPVSPHSTLSQIARGATRKDSSCSACFFRSYS
jgi:GNAT superfamily N-acetyltransferase